MKSRMQLCLIAVGLLFCANLGYAQTPPGVDDSGPAPFVSETQAELGGSLDADGDGALDFLVVDKASGVSRLGLQQADGSFRWNEPASTGLDEVTGLGIGRFAGTSSPQGFAVAAPLWNRVVVFPDAAGDPIVAPTVGVGPNLVVGCDFAGDARDDLGIGTLWEKSAAPVHLSGLVADTNGWVVGYGPHEEAGALSKGNRVRFSAQRPWMLCALREADGGREFISRPFSRFPGGVDGPTLTGLPADTDWAWGQFKTNDLARFIFYSPGTSNLYVPALLEPLPYQYSWTTGVVYRFDLPISRVLVLPLKTGSLLLILFGDGTTAATYDYDGDQAPTLRQTFTPSQGSSFSIGGALANGDFLLLSGPTGATGPSTAWQHWGFDGTQHNLAGSGTLPPLAAAQGRANVLLFASNPDLDPVALLLGTIHVGDWSDGAVLAGGEVHVTREQFLGSAQGLGLSAVSDVAVAPSVFFAAVNQHALHDSISILEPPTPQGFAEVSFSPRPGTYHPAAGFFLEVRIVSAAGGPVQYRLGAAQPWMLYDATHPIRLSTSTTIQAFVDAALPGPIRSAAYLMADAPAIAVTPPVFSNNNGLPDAWSQAFGVTDPQGDPDGDGATNLQEYLAGTDPLDSLSVPSGNTELSHVAIVVRLPGADAPAGTICEVAWPATLARVTLEATDDLGNPSSWTAANGIETTVGAERVHYQPPVPARAATYYRLRALP